MKKNAKSYQARKTRLGRMLCRFLGDERGAVAMEYVVIALLVGAVVVGLVMVFGRSLAGMFDATTQAVAGGEAGIAAAAETRVEQVAATNEGLKTQKANAKTISSGAKDGSGGAAGE